MTDAAGYRITAMMPDHLEQVASVERQSFTLPWSQNSFRELLENPSAAFFCAIDNDGSVSGYAGLFYVPGDDVCAGSAEIMNIAVRSDRRRQGIAAALMRRLEEYAADKGASVLMLEVRRSNQAARSLYLLLGYRDVGIRRNYYSHPKEDAILMNKIITPQKKDIK
jgi:ribosomal-protein-alanine N-acetyltransferase